MKFLPRMQSHIEGISVLGDLRWRAWDGVVADVWNVECSRSARGEYVSFDPRLVIVLSKVGQGGMHLLRSPEQPAKDRSDARQPINYVPAGLRLWSEFEDIQALQHLDLHFDLAALRTRFGVHLDAERVEAPRLMFSDERLMGLARLIAAECINPDASADDLYGDSLIAALIATLWPIKSRPKRKRGQLSPRQLQQLVDFIEDNCLRNIRLQDLSELTGLSQEYIGRAFKASTGMPLHGWQMKARIERVKSLLERANLTLPEIAHATGFSDQAHLTRVFRRVAGTTPAAWQRRRAL